MFKKLFFPKKGEKQDNPKPGVKSPGSPKPGTEPDVEFQMPPLYRRDYAMTVELLRRREEEALRRHYQLFPSKTGTYL